MSDRQALISAIKLHPLEDTPRLAFADYLDECGDQQWAEFIRVQIATANGALDASLIHRERALWVRPGDGLPRSPMKSRFNLMQGVCLRWLPFNPCFLVRRGFISAARMQMVHIYTPLWGAGGLRNLLLHEVFGGLEYVEVDCSKRTLNKHLGELRRLYPEVAEWRLRDV